MIEFIRNESTLMAYADGELEAPLAAALEEEMRRDPKLLSELVGFIRTRRVAKAAMMSNPSGAGGEIPRALGERSAVAPPRARPKPGVRGLLLAAGLAGAAFLGGAMLGHVQPGGPLALLGTAQLAEALDSKPSGSEIELQGRTLRLVGTFQSSSSLCREAEISGEGERTSAVMCRSGESWKPALTVAVSERGYEPAAGPTLVDDYLRGIGAGRIPDAAESEVLERARVAGATR